MDKRVILAVAGAGKTYTLCIKMLMQIKEI